MLLVICFLPRLSSLELRSERNQKELSFCRLLTGLGVHEPIRAPRGKDGPSPRVVQCIQYSRSDANNA
jgi:hypothetical protein